MSSKSKHHALEGALPAKVLLLIRFFSAAALAVAAYLAWLSFGGENIVGCGPDSGCVGVLNSRWAYWLGLPVSALGFLIYLTLFLGTFRLGSKVGAQSQRHVWVLLVPAAILAVGAALWFAGLQILVIKHVCPFCMTAHGSALVAAGLLLLNAPFRSAPEKPWQQEKQVYVAPALAKRLVLAGVAGLAVMTAGQFLHVKKSYLEQGLVGGARIESGTNGQAAASTSASQAGSLDPSKSQASTSGSAPRFLQLHEGKIKINLDEVPVLGNRHATNIMIELHDYTCHGCQTMHGPLKTVRERYSNELAIVSLPMPLDGLCNPLVKQTRPAHSNACEFARISLAVWRSNPESMEAFNDWVFGPPSPPPVLEAYTFARQLVGATAFDKFINDPWIPAQLQQFIALYGLNYQAYSNSSMPQFLIGTNMTFGSLSADLFLQKITNQYRLMPKP